MEDKLLLPIEFDVNNPQLQQEMNEAKKVISGAGQSVSDVEKKINTDLNTISNHALKSKSSFNGLQNSINQISRELPAFTYSAQTGFMAISNNLPILFDEISKVRKENDALVASGQKGVPVWKQLASSLFSWGTLLSVGVTLLTVYGKEIGNWIKTLFKGKDALAELKKQQAEFNSVRLKGTQDAQKELTSLKSIYDATQNTSLSLKERNKAVDALQSKFPAYFKNMSNEAILAGQAKGAYDQLTQSIIAAAQARAYENKIAEISSKIIENNDKVTEKAASITDSDRLGMQLDQKRIRSGGMMMFTNGSSDAYTAIKDIKNINKETADLTKTMDKYKTAISNLVNVNGVGVITGDVGGTKGVENAKNTLDNYRSLLSEISDLDNEYSRQKFDEDKAELLALEDKFSKIRKKIIEFNNNKENKIKINLNDLDPIQENAKNNLNYTQNTNKLQKQYEEEYKIFQQYEELKKSTNVQYANERFATQLEAIKSFEQRLNDELSKIYPNTTNELERKRLEGLNKVKSDLAEKSQAEEDKMFAEALVKYADYNEKRVKIIEEAEKEITKLTQERKFDEADTARKKRNQNLIDLAKSEIEAGETYKDVMKTIDKSSQSMIVSAFKTGKDTVYGLIDGLKDATEEEKVKLKKLFGEFFDKGIKDAELGNLESISQMSDSFADLVQSSLDFASNIGEGAEQLASMVNVASQLAGQLGAFFKNESLQKLGAGLGMAGAGIGVLNSIGSAINSRLERKDSERQAAIEKSNERQLKSTEAVTKMLERQLDLINEIYGNARLEEYANKLGDIQSNWNELNKQLEGRFKMTGDTFVDSILKRLNNGESFKEIRNSLTRGMMPGSKEFTRILETIAKIQSGKLGETFGKLPDDIKTAREELASLDFQISSGNADEYTTQLYNQLKAQLDLYDQTLNKLREESTGNAFSTVLNDVKNLFKNNGEDSAEAWAKSFDNIMENYILQKFSRDYLEKALQDWYTLLDEYATSDGAIDENEKKALQDAYNKIQEDGQKRVDQIKDAMGYDPSSKGSNDNITGRISRNITETTGSAILGFERSRYDLAKKNNMVAEKALDFHAKSHDLMTRQLRHQAAIEQNTANTVDELKSAVVELKSINKNTSKTGRSAEGMGL